MSVCRPASAHAALPDSETRRQGARKPGRQGDKEQRKTQNHGLSQVEGSKLRTQQGASMPQQDAFRGAVEAHDLDAMVAAFAPAALLGILLDVFEDFRYTDQLDAADGTRGLVFRARVGSRDVEGIDLLRFDDAGLIRDLTVMV